MQQAGLRATGVDFDVRKWRPYSGWAKPFGLISLSLTTVTVGDCVMIKAEEMRQSIRILEQCYKNMPEGPFKADHPLTTPPKSARISKP